MRRALYCAIALLVPVALTAQVVQPQARFVASTIPGTLRYQVVIEGAGRGEISGVLGQLDNLEVLAGPVLTQQIVWRGDRAVAVTALTWVLRARKLGPIAVGPTTVRFGNDEAVTNPVHGTALAGGHAASEAPRPELRVDLSRSRLLVGEPLVVRFFVESPGGSLAGGWEVQASFPESWSERLPLEDVAPSAANPEAVQLGGWLVIPVRTGRLEIPPAVARAVTAPGEAESVALPAKVVTSRATGADVTPLPPAPAPFFGAVGELAFSRRLLESEMHAGDLVTLEVAVEGVGNLPLLDPPPLRLPEGLRAFPAEENHEWKPTRTGLAGWRRWRIPLEVLQPGKFELPAVRFCSFGPEARYATHTLPALALVVRPATTPARAAVPPSQRPVADRALPGPLLLAVTFVLGVACAAVVLAWRVRRRVAPSPRGPNDSPAQELRGLQLAVEGWARTRFGVAVGEGADRLAAAGCPPAEAAEAVALVQACERLRFAPSLADPADALANLRLRVARLVATTPHHADTLEV